ncbi:hypothetical protein IQ13_4227 [Lacibacter cauensis]|uniref:Lipoprotein n=1 Tax=Lacibacter cauensis TaxID=510947 RepID=A0A562SAU5_9BACT|nr:hypothetical protein [Lacibacter cauensis]TWI77984.1 hypothetical protein IQ13_4227 [Lacibacter cauensis]
MNTNLTLLKLPAFLLLFLLSCGQTTNNQTKTAEVNIHSNDTSNYVILNFDTTNTSLSNNTNPTLLTRAEIEEIDIILKQCVDNYNPEQKLKFDTLSKEHPEYNLKVDDFVIDLSRYKRQYLPFLNSAGQKEVWVNCFCSDFANWRKEILTVKDGGNCYFSLTINLSTNTFSYFMVNGEA